jgi:signal transduction histidine kinase
MIEAITSGQPDEKILTESCDEKLTRETQKLSIVIIDDNPDDRILIRHYLMQSIDFRCTILEADSATSGLHLCQEVKPDCVILDMSLPDLDGLAVLQQLKDCESEVPFPVVVLTGNSDRGANGQAAISAGAQDYISKNWINAESLCRTVVNSIERFQLMRVKKEKQALKQADRRKNEFIATLAHELRNPLAPIRNGLKLMRLARGDKETIAQARDMMERQLNQMVRLVDDLLDISRISNDKLELRKTTVELSLVIQQAVESVKPMIDAAKQVLEIEVPKKPIFLNADFARLAQVFANLLTNASKFTSAEGHIWLTAKCDNGTVVASVKDDGIGLSAEQQGQVFEMFSQIEQPLERSQTGLGIGLALTRRFVEMHDGVVEVRSNGLGSGSEFIVRLPILEKIDVSTANLTNDPDNEPTNRTRLRILVVDDNRDAAESLAMVLKLTGHDVETAYDGRAAIDAAATLRPDVVLLDIGLPMVNGYEACRQIRGQEWGRKMKIIAVTGWGQDDDRQKTKDAGFNDHLIKPVEPAEIIELLEIISKPT